MSATNARVAGDQGYFGLRVLEERRGKGPIQLTDPGFVEKSIEYDPSSGNYLISRKWGTVLSRPPSQMGFQEYLDYRGKELEQEYFNKLSGLSTARNSLSTAWIRSPGLT